MRVSTACRSHARIASAHLPILVKIRVDTLPVREIVHRRWLLWELGRQLQIEHKDRILIRRARRARDQRAQQVDPCVGNRDKDARRQPRLQKLPLLLRRLRRQQASNARPSEQCPALKPHRAREFCVRLTFADGPVGAAELPEEEEPCS